MQFLLLLSALLSAVTGAFAGPRAVEAPVSQAEAQVAATARPAARVMIAAILPQRELRRPRADRETGAVAPAAVIAAAPLTDIRLNE